MKIRLLSRQTIATTSEYNDDDQQSLIEEAEQIAAQKSLQRELEFEREMLLEREHRVQQIEADILDVNEIMRELGAMVHEQGDTISKWRHYQSEQILFRRYTLKVDSLPWW
jgi:hypothetical protein